MPGFEVSSSKRGRGPGCYGAPSSPTPALGEGLAARSEPSPSASRNARKSRRKCESRRTIAGKSSSHHAVSGLSSTSNMRWINDSMSSYSQVTCGPNSNELRATRGVSSSRDGQLGTVWWKLCVSAPCVSAPSRWKPTENPAAIQAARQLLVGPSVLHQLEAPADGAAVGTV